MHARVCVHHMCMLAYVYTSILARLIKYMKAEGVKSATYANIGTLVCDPVYEIKYNTWQPSNAC